MAVNLVFDEEAEERYEKLKDVYQRTFPQKFRAIIRKTIIFKLARIVLVVKEPTFYPDKERKSAIKRFNDNLSWLFKYNEVNTLYNRYGLDIKNFRNIDDYLSNKASKKQKEMQHHEDHPLTQYRKDNINIRYSIIADNKHLFYEYMDSIIPNSVPKTNFIFQGDKIVSPITKNTNLKKAIMSLKDGKYIIKPTLGAKGDLIVALKKEGKKLEFSDKNVDIDVLIHESKDVPFLLQEFLKQHDDLNKLNDESVNTLRVISTHWNEDVHILAAMIRIGAKKGQVVDNASAGGTFVGVDIDKGVLREYGYYYDRPRSKNHPITGVTYKDYKIPYWDEVVQLIKDVHPVIFGFATIGWDIAITPDGPVVVEINQHYAIKGIQICNGGLRKRWDELMKK